MSQNYTEHLRCQFTDAELLDMGRRAALANQQIERDRESIREVAAQFKAQIAANEKQLHLLTQLIAQGYEYRDVECEVRLDDPEPGKKSIYRNDTGAFVKFMEMGDMDRQIRLEIEPEEPVPVVDPPTAGHPLVEEDAI